MTDPDTRRGLSPSEKRVLRQLLFIRKYLKTLLVAVGVLIGLALALFLVVVLC